MGKDWPTLMVAFDARLKESIVTVFKLLYDTVQLSYPMPADVYVAIVIVSIGWIVGGTSM